MSCDRCDECRERGDNFCIYCGEMLGPMPRSECDRCSECLDDGYTYCMYCGKRLIPEENVFLKIGYIVGIIAMLFVTFFLLFEYAVAIWGIPRVLPHLPDYGSTLILVIPEVIDILSFDGVSSQIYYILLFIAVTVSISLLIFNAYGPTVALINGDDKKIRDTALFDVSILFLVLLIWEIIYIAIARSMGIEITTLPDHDDWVWMYELLEASVWEEVITRMLMIGLPMAIVAVAKEEKGSWKKLFGGFEMDGTALFFILFSAIMFGAGHVGGWGWWKFLPTFVFGLIAGYLFTKYGVYATISMHFLNDYMSAESWIVGTDSAMTTLLMLLIAFFCIPFTYIYVKRCVLALRKILFNQSNVLR